MMRIEDVDVKEVFFTASFLNYQAIALMKCKIKYSPILNISAIDLKLSILDHVTLFQLNFNYLIIRNM